MDHRGAGQTIGRPWRFGLAIALLGCSLGLCGLALAQADRQPRPPRAPAAQGPRDLVLGQSAPLSGPSGQLGREYRAGALAWFDDVNRRGGIHGRRLRLLSLDDRYEPALTLRNTERLIQADKAFALFGYVGTPTVQAVLPLLKQAGIPLVAPLSGASLLRQPDQRMVINLRTSYQAEIDRIVADLVRSGRQRIAVLHQQDAFGSDGLAASRRALARHGLQPVAIASIPRNSTDARTAAARLHAADPSGVILITGYPGAAAVSQELLRHGSDAQLMSVSFVGTRGLEDALPGGRGNGIGIAQVVPFPWNARLPVVAEYQRLMRRQGGPVHYGFVSLEGFLAARLFTEALQRSGPDPDRGDLLRAFAGMGHLDLGGFRVSLGPKDRQASDFVELTFLGSQRWEP